MKKMLSVLLTLALIFSVFSICDPCADASGPVWKKEFVKDVFGDPLEEYMLTNSESLIGTYNSVQVNDGYLTADMFFQRDGGTLNAYIKLYENGVDQVKNGSDSDIRYDVTVKCPDGSKYTGDAVLRSTSDRIELNQTMTLANALCATAGEVMVYLEDTVNPLNNYLFNAPCGNFFFLFETHIINAYLEEQYQYAIKLFEGGSLDQAADIFRDLGDYSDSSAYLAEIEGRKKAATREANKQLNDYVDNSQVTTLSVYAWDANFNIPALKAAEAAYQKVNPGFSLEIVQQAGSSDVEQAVTLAASSGNLSTLPDIVLFRDHYIQRYVSDYPNAWVSVDDAGIDWSDFGAEKISYGTVNGVHYGVPVDNGTVIFAYRTDILEQCGYTLDDVTGISWDRWLEIARDVKAKTGKALLSMDHSGDDLPYMMMQAEGVSQFKDGKAWIVGNESLKKIVEVIVQGARDGTIILANSWSEYTDRTIQGDQVAGVMNGNWIIPTIRQVAENSGKWAITTIPTLTGAHQGYAANGGSSLYITGNCKNVELAKEFLAYTFGGGEGATETYDNALIYGGVITSCISAGASDVYLAPIDYFNGQAIYNEIVNMGAHVPVVEQNDFHYTLRTSVGKAITSIMNGTDIDTALKNAQDEMDFAMTGW